MDYGKYLEHGRIFEVLCCRKQSSSSFSSCSTSSELPPAAAGQLVRSSAGSCASLSSPRPRPGPATPTRKTSKRQSHLADIPDQEADQEQGEDQEQEQEQEAEVKRRVTSASASTSGRQLTARWGSLLCKSMISISILETVKHRETFLY